MKTPLLQLKYPIVLVHGLGAQNTYGPIDYFFGLKPLLIQNGNQVLIPRLKPWKRIETRVNELRQQINQIFPDSPVNLVGHSLGGLDARYLTALSEFRGRVASVTSIGTPHRGSPLADLATTVLPFLNQMESYSLRQVTRPYSSQEFEKWAPDIANVGYFSATSAIAHPLLFKALPLFWISHGLIQKQEGDNDGFVSVHSATHGQLICVGSGDHYAQIGQILGYTRGMDYMKFYQTIFKRLKKEGL